MKNSKEKNSFYYRSVPVRPGLSWISLFVSLVVAVGMTACSRQSTTNQQAANQQRQNGGNQNPQAATPQNRNLFGMPIQGGTFEASGAAFVPNTDAVLLVNDDKDDEVVLMRIDPQGNQVGEARRLKIAADVENPEGITTDGKHFYMVGSQASPKKGVENAIVRFSFDPATQSVSGVETIGDLRSLLVSKVADLRGEGEKKGSHGGLNIEGLAWDPTANRLLLGLRSPIPNGEALIIPVGLRDAAGPFSAANLNFDQSQPMRLRLEGNGIRDIQYDERLKSFLIISGAPEDQEKGAFTLWRWNPGSEPVRKADLDSAMKPEGVTRVSIGGQNFILLVGDASRYLRYDYAEGE